MLEIGINGQTITFDIGTLLVWLLVGLIAGLLARFVTGRRGSILTDIFLGILGAFVGGFFLSLVAPVFSISVEPWWLRAFVTAFIGAILIIAIVRLFTFRRYRRYDA